MEELMKTFAAKSIQQIVVGALVLIVGLWLTNLIMRFAERPLSRLRKLNPSLHALVKTALRVLLQFIAIVMAAGTMGIPISSFVALFSVVGLAFSLAVQGALSNLAGGIIILTSKPFSLEDFIECDGISGTVDEIGFLNTTLLDANGRKIFVPNGLIYTNRVINYTQNGKRRIELNVSASYDNTPDEVRAAIMEAVEQVPQILENPSADVVLDTYGANDIGYVVHAWVNAADFVTAKFALNEKIFWTFRKRNVQMSYPHVNVHMQ